MKRLIRLSSVTLQHATTFESFKSICNDGYIYPYSQTQIDRHSNSLDSESVYVSKFSGYEFAIDMMYSSKYSIGIFMKLKLDEDNLLPSYDYKEYTFPETDENGQDYWVDNNGNKIINENLTWEDTINIFDECRYKGPISTDDIVSVKFLTNNKEMLEKFNDFFDRELSFNEAREFAELIN